MDNIQQMLELMDRPAFCVEGGIITAVNRAAAGRQVEPGTELAPLLATGRDSYDEFTDGHLCLSLKLFGEPCAATVSSVDGRHIFTLDDQDPHSELRMLELAAMELREPLNAVMSLVEELPEDMDPDQLARINKGLHQLLRIVGNMSGHPVPRFEMLELNALLREIWDSAQPACDSRGIRFDFVPCPAPVYSCADEELLTRAVHNLLSNALKYTPEGGRVELKLTMSKTAYRIALHSSGEVPGPIADPFTRYRRMPGIEDGRNGLGLGLMLVRCAAIAHGGTALLDRPKGGGVRVTLHLPRYQDRIGLRSTRHVLPYFGERSPLLIELSDVLPPEFYKK